jgi:hypothetical protein
LGHGGLLQGRDVDLLHVQHGAHRPLRCLRIRIIEELNQPRRDDLPGHAVLVFQPAALALFAALGQPGPELIDPSWVWQRTWNEIASLNVNSGPPLRATNSCPSSSKLTVMTKPSGLGPALP